MRDDRYRFLAIAGHLPARLTAEQVSWILNFQAHDVPVLVLAKLLKPLGSPLANSVTYFATIDILDFAKDKAWLSRATNAVSQHWKQKNLSKKGRAPRR